MQHLLENSSLPNFSQALTNLAHVILNYALQQSHGVINEKASLTEQVPLAIFGLGKLGGGELGYASDIEILFVYQPPQHAGKGKPLRVSPDYFERWAQEFLQWIEAKQEGIFHIDTRLRPYGHKGTLANSLEEIQRYYHSQGAAAPFERQAFIKLRFVAGNRALGKAIETHRDHFVYGSEPWDLKTALHLRQRQMTELVKPATTHVKYGPGGLLDVEYMIRNYPYHGRTVHACLIRDISEIKHSREIIEKQEQTIVQVSKMSELGELAGGIAHEINNPLSIISGMAEEMRYAMENDSLDREGAEFLLHKIEDTTDRISKIIRGLRNYARDGSQDPFQEGDLTVMLEESFELWHT